MRRISRPATVRATRLGLVTTTSATLAFGLLAMLAQAGQAAPAGPRSDARLAALLAARGMRPRGMHPRPMASAIDDVRGLTSVTAIPATGHGRSAGVLTGLLRGVTGTPVSGVCVTAVGPAGQAMAASNTAGRYLLSGLRPGRYSLHLGSCPGATPAGAQVISSSWPGLPQTVAVRAGQIRTLVPASVLAANPAALAASLAAQRRPLTAAARARTGSISGTVTGNGRPQRRVCVVAISASGNNPETLVRTSRTGRYQIKGLPTGSYGVVFLPNSSLCHNGGNWLPQWYPNLSTLFPGSKLKLVQVRAAHDTSDINARLRLGGEFSGVVRTSAGQPAQGICVRADGFLSEDDEIELDSIAVTNKAGHYAAHGLFPGNYRTEFSIGCGAKGNYAFQWWRDTASEGRAANIKIAGQSIVAGIDPTLHPGATVTGTVRAETSARKPIAGVCVDVDGNDGGDTVQAVTRPDGRYTLKGLSTGRFRIQFDPSCAAEAPGRSPVNFLPAHQKVTVRAGRTRTGVNIALAPAAGISGVVTDSRGHRVSGVCVDIGNNDIGNNDADETVSTGKNGTYSEVGIKPGKYAVAFSGGCGNPGSLAPQFYDHQQDPDATATLNLAAGTITKNINAAMRPGGTITGLVTDRAGRKLNNICVFAGDFDNVEFTVTGRYLISDLTPGAYPLDFGCQGPDQKYANQWFRSQSNPAAADTVSVSASVTTTINAKLSLAGEISGVVTDPAGHPLGDVCPSVSSAASRSEPVNSESSGAKKGHYLIGGLAPGRYVVLLQDCDDRYASVWYRGKASAASATVVRVRSGKVTSAINARLTVGGSISGVVTGPSGKPLGGICVNATDAAGGADADASGFAETTKTGRYTMTGLSTAGYTVGFLPCATKLPNLGTVQRPGIVHVIAPHAVTGIDIKLALGGTASGTVLGGTTGTAPLDSVCVLLLPVNPNSSQDLTETDAAGQYQVSDLAVGQYLAYFGDPSCGTEFDDEVSVSAPQWFSDQPTQATAVPFTVTAGHRTSHIGATLGTTYGSISGTVTDGAKTGAGGECVAAVPFPASVDLASGAPLQSEIAQTSGSGRYNLASLPPGNYKIKFSAGCGGGGFATQWWHNAKSAQSATVITVRYAAIRDINATLHH